MNLSEEVLMGIAAVAIALIGFSGVVTALGRRNNRTWSQSESIQLFALVVPAIVTLASTFVPVGLGLIIENSDIVWRVANGVCFLAHLLSVSKFLRDGSTESIRFSHKIGLTITFSVMVAMLISSLGIGAWPQFTFLLGLLLGIGVSVHNFYFLPLAVMGTDSPSTDSGRKPPLRCFEVAWLLRNHNGYPRLLYDKHDSTSGATAMRVL